MSCCLRYALIAGFGLLATSSPVMAAPDTWDPRLTELGICYVEADVAPGTWYWKLVSGVFEDEDQSGGTHHIYYKCLDASGDPIEDQKTWAAWPTNNNGPVCGGNPTNFASQLTKGPGFDNYWGNFAMSGGWCPFWPEGGRGPFGAYVDGPSDQVWGMGMPCNRHVSYRYIWRRTQKVSPQPAIGRSPPSISRTISQGQNPSSDSITVWNDGGGTLIYSVTDNAGWLSVVPATGDSTGPANTHTVNYTAGDLPLGTHNATITISDPNAASPTETIAVSVNVQPPVYRGDFDGDGDVDQEDFAFFQRCLSGSGFTAAPECAVADFDGDGDVDADDFELFQACMSGANVSPPNACLQ